MANFFNFTKIVPAAPSDPLVDEAAQLNANWDHMDARLTPLMLGGTLTLAQAGQEYLDSNSRFAVWDGAAARIPDDIDSAWSAWTNIPMLAPRAIRSTFQPKWRSNSLLRKVELSGGISFDVSSNVWTQGTLFQFNALSAGSPANTLGPVGGKHVNQAATGLTAGTSVTAGAYIVIDTSGSFTRMSCQYLGGGGGGNFVQLEQVWWWY
jgi:hypothetical protein